MGIFWAGSDRSLNHHTEHTVYFGYTEQLPRQRDGDRSMCVLHVEGIYRLAAAWAVDFS